MPKLSIITINLNNQDGLERTIKSVISQKFNDFEFIVVDGLSTDGSSNIIRKFRKSIDFYISEKDNGIFSAMNKGIRISSGEYCLFLNSGDFFVSSSTLQKFFGVESDRDILFGDAKFILDRRRYLIIKYPDVLKGDFFLNDNLCHQATFIKRDLFVKYGCYSEKYKISSDWLFFLQTILLQKCSYQHIRQIVTNYDFKGVSSIQNGLVQSEREQILKKIFETEPELKGLLKNNYKYRIRFIDRMRNKFFKIIKYE